MGINQQLFGYIDACPTAFHTVAHTADMLEDAGYTRLSETESWKLRPGEGYFVTRNGSSLIAFRVPEEEFPCFMIAAAHGDAPTFKIKENAGITDKNYVRLSTEKYGGMLCATGWIARWELRDVPSCAHPTDWRRGRSIWDMIRTGTPCRTPSFRLSPST